MGLLSCWAVIAGAWPAAFSAGVPAIRGDAELPPGGARRQQTPAPWPPRTVCRKDSLDFFLKRCLSLAAPPAAPSSSGQPTRTALEQSSFLSP